MEIEDFYLDFTYNQYKAMTIPQRIDVYNYIYMLINNASLDFNMPKLACLDWLKKHCHEHEAYEHLQILKDFEMHHENNLKNYF
jgi:hypothetical protein